VRSKAAPKADALFPAQPNELVAMPWTVLLFDIDQTLNL